MSLFLPPQDAILKVLYEKCVQAIKQLIHILSVTRLLKQAAEKYLEEEYFSFRKQMQVDTKEWKKLLGSLYQICKTDSFSLSKNKFRDLQRIFL